MLQCIPSNRTGEIAQRLLQCIPSNRAGEIAQQLLHCIPSNRAGEIAQWLKLLPHTMLQYIPSNRAREIAQWLELLLHKHKNQGLDPENLLQILGKHGGLPVIPATEGGDRASIKQSRAAREINHY